ncbi:unnamed protein product [Rotaria sordida]|uniref:Endonuclease/exonuclease/phosphatase domain-containing protein n=1 Tax=Rotaria sordida TaxID=392033 RepID=A0A815B696_9BILA|nr:unnamed protein product [Rotaria sordida]CAF3873309.1 unnamed protein product [Rotaria sordida]
MTVRILSYNILVPSYADQPEIYSKCQPKFLKTDYRWNLIRSQLVQEIQNHENTIICLQELSLTLLPEFELFFRQLNYTLFHHLYGRRHNDCMGTGIAIPASMELNSLYIIRIGDFIHSISKPREKQANSLASECNLNESDTQEILLDTLDPWETAMDRINALICIKVTINNKSIHIGTYHMPCLYKDPDVMLIHSSIVKDRMFHLAGGQNFILVGDFNFNSTDICYKALTEKNFLNCRLPESSKYEISYQRNAEQVLKSAYREKNGVEPTYTNFAHTPNCPDYCDTLDYIFFNGNLTIENVLELPDHPSGESYPDETHPSDHLMIAATIQLS